MHLHGQKQSKKIENEEKSTFSIQRTRGSCKAHEENEEKSLFLNFPMFLIVFDHANAYASMRLLVEIHNILQ